MSGNYQPVGFDKRSRERAKLESKAMFCVSVNREYCKHLPDNERGVVTMWGPTTDAGAADVSRLLLKLSGVNQEEIDKLYPPPTVTLETPMNEPRTEASGLLAE
jgi:hypothetical protein